MTRQGWRVRSRVDYWRRQAQEGTEFKGGNGSGRESVEEVVELET